MYGVIDRPIPVFFRAVCFHVDGALVLLDAYESSGGQKRGRLVWKDLTRGKQIPTDPSGPTVVDLEGEIDPAVFQHSGRINLLVKAIARFNDTKEHIVSNLVVPLMIVNDQPDASEGVSTWHPTSGGRTQGGDPADRIDYSNVELISAPPLHPISAAYPVTIRYLRAQGTPGASSEILATLDPNLHAHPPELGEVHVRETVADFISTRTVVLNPSSMAEGSHRLMARTMTDNLGKSPLQATLLVPSFSVGQGAPPPPPPPPSDTEVIGVHLALPDGRMGSGSVTVAASSSVSPAQDEDISVTLSREDGRTGIGTVTVRQPSSG